MKRALVVAVMAVMVASVPRPAVAGFALNFSIGEGVDVGSGGALHRGRFNLEAIPAWSFDLDPAFLSVDLGFHFFAEPPVELTLRPGVRIGLKWIYARGAIPLKVNNGFDWGFLLGLGSEFISWGPLGLFLEADTFFTRDRDWVNPVAIEFRFGLALRL